MGGTSSMETAPAAPVQLVRDLTKVPTQTLRRWSVWNLLRMGHCAPTVMQTLLDASDTEAEWLVKLTAGLPGGIGNTGGECGGVTAPLVLIGLRYARDATHDGLPPVIEKGHDLLQRFANCHGTTLCREIRGMDRLPLRCVGAVRQAPEFCAQTLSSDCADVIPAARRAQYRRLYSHFVAKDFHCAHAVVKQVRHMNPLGQDVLDATSPFIGGTVLTGMTCSALTAGVMALSVALGEVERSRRRVLRMIGTMAAGGNAFANDLNKFNRVMNLGHQLAGVQPCAREYAMPRSDGLPFRDARRGEPVYRDRRRVEMSGDGPAGRCRSRPGDRFEEGGSLCSRSVTSSAGRHDWPEESADATQRPQQRGDRPRPASGRGRREVTEVCRRLGRVLPTPGGARASRSASRA